MHRYPRIPFMAAGALALGLVLGACTQPAATQSPSASPSAMMEETASPSASGMMEESPSASDSGMMEETPSPSAS